MDIVKWAEFIYYIAFIVLTLLIVYYARKTFEFESKSTYELLCGLVVQEASDDFALEYSLEVYNAGNQVAKKVSMSVDNKYVTTIDFVKPRSSSIFPVGVVTLWEKQVLKGPEVSKDHPLSVTLSIDGKEISYSVCTDLLFAKNNLDYGSLKETNQQLREINRSLSQLSMRR